MQNYFLDWITKFYINFLQGKIDIILSLLDKEEKFTFEKTYKNVTTRDHIESIITQIIKFKLRPPLNENFTQNFNEFIISHFLFRINKYRENYHKSFVNLKESFTNFTEIFRNLEIIIPYNNFISSLNFYPIMKYFMRNLLFSSRLADMELEKKNLKPQSIDECGRILITFFSQFQMSEEKPLVFYAIICLIRIHFKMRTYRNSKTLVGWVEKSGLNFNELNKSEVVTFFYYSGRLSLYELRLIEAREIFMNASNLCKENQFVNKRLIFEYLIPLNLFYGILPTYEVIKKYKLEEYQKLIEAYKNGNLLKFEDSICKLEDRLISLGTFLIIEKLKCYVMRNLVKNIYKNFNLFVKDKPVIKIEMIYNVLVNVVGMNNFTQDELELYLIGVIHKGLISGYIHNNNKVIVFSKKSPFPILPEVFKNNYNKII